MTTTEGRTAARGSAVALPGSLAGIALRLRIEFPLLPLKSVIAVVRRCRRELEISSGPTGPASIERLARRRLAGPQPSTRKRAAAARAGRTLGHRSAGA